MVQVPLRRADHPGVIPINLEDRRQERREPEAARTRAGLSQHLAEAGKPYPPVARRGRRVSYGLQIALSGITFAECAIGHVVIHLGEKLLVDIDETEVLACQPVFQTDVNRVETQITRKDAAMRRISTSS